MGVIKNSLVYRWIYLLGLENDAKQYFYKATLKNEITGNEISFQHQVRSMVESSDSIIKSENAFVLSVTTCKKYRNEGTNQVNYKIELQEEYTKRKDDFEESTKSIEKCVICLDNPLEIALKACGHLVSCHDCAKRLPYECPICRSPIDGTLKIYFP